ncbi:diaminopimelate decarboxylase [Lysobacter olei]
MVDLEGIANDGVFGGVDLAALAEREGTPLYVYSPEAIRGRFQALQRALAGLDADICYAVKANGNRAVLELLAAEGSGADIVSGGELRRALQAGIPADRIVFSGVGKSVAEMHAALEAGVARFNVESLAELETLQAVAREHGTVARASVRINPDVDALTHAKISTGRAENKFGVSIAEARGWFQSAERWPNIRLDGLHMHIGSQLLSLEPLREAIARMADFARERLAAGSNIACIDVGGGLGVRYREGECAPSADEYAAIIPHGLGWFNGRILVEPGRWLVAEAGLLLSRVMLEKQGDTRRFLVLDAAMNDLLRPSLYEAWHDVVPLPHGSPGDEARVAYDVVGPVCETGDTFATARLLPRCHAGQLVAILASGAYGASMASNYNSRPLPAEVFVEGGRYAVVRRRQTFDEMVAAERPATDWTSP